MTNTQSMVRIIHVYVEVAMSNVTDGGLQW